MTARDAKGRFTTAADHASTLLLEAAVAEAVEVLRTRVGRLPGYDLRGMQYQARVTLVHACYAADLLMRRAG